MGSKEKTYEEEIQEVLAEGKRIVFASTDEIENYDAIAAEFLKTIFDLDIEEMFASDESTLSDFAGCCCPPDLDEDRVLSIEDYYKICRIYTVQKVYETYGIEVEPYDSLIRVFELIWRKNKQHTH